MSQEQSARDKQDQTTASPWAASLRRRLQRSSLAADRTQALVVRMQQTNRRTVVWQPGLGSLRPALVQRFASAVAERIQRAKPGILRRRLRREAASAPGDWSGELDMTLPSGPEAEPPASSQPLPPGTFTVGQRIEPMRTKPSRESGIQRSPSTPPAPKRTASKPPQRQGLTHPPRSRLYARVEEVKGTGASPPQPLSPAPKPEPEARGEDEPRAPAIPTPPAAAPRSQRLAVQRRAESAPPASGPKRNRVASQPAGRTPPRTAQPAEQPAARPETAEEEPSSLRGGPADSRPRSTGDSEASTQAAGAQRAAMPPQTDDVDEELPLATGPADGASVPAHPARELVDETPRQEPKLGRVQRAPASQPPAGRQEPSRAQTSSVRREPARSEEEPPPQEPGPAPAREEEPAPPADRESAPPPAPPRRAPDSPATVQRQADFKPQGEPRPEPSDPHEPQPGRSDSPGARRETKQTPTESAAADRPPEEPEPEEGRSGLAPLPPVEEQDEVEMPLRAGSHVEPAKPVQPAEPGVPAPPEPAPDAAPVQRAPEPREPSARRQGQKAEADAVEPQRPAPASVRETSGRARPDEKSRMSKSAAEPPAAPGEARSEERQVPDPSARSRPADDAPVAETGAQQPARIQRTADRDRETPGSDEPPDQKPLPQAKSGPPGTKPGAGQTAPSEPLGERDMPVAQDRRPTAKIDRRAQEPGPSGARRAMPELPVGDQGPRRPQAAEQKETAVDEAAPGLERALQVRAQERAQASLLRSAQRVTPAPVRIARQPVPWIARLVHRKRREATPKATESAQVPVPAMGTPALGGQNDSAAAISLGAMVLPALGRPAPARAASRAAPQPLQRTTAAAAPAATPRPRTEKADEDRLPLAKPRVPQSQAEAKVEEPEAAARQTRTAAETVTAAPPAVQRAVEDEMDDERELDLGVLAERVYPFIKRMLQIERERRPYA